MLKLLCIKIKCNKWHNMVWDWCQRPASLPLRARERDKERKRESGREATEVKHKGKPPNAICLQQLPWGEDPITSLHVFILNLMIPDGYLYILYMKYAYFVSSQTQKHLRKKQTDCMHVFKNYEHWLFISFMIISNTVLQSKMRQNETPAASWLCYRREV